MAFRAAVPTAIVLLLGAWGCAAEEAPAGRAVEMAAAAESVCRHSSFLRGVSQGEIPAPCVRTANGLDVEGIWLADHVRAFLGIPFAKPPVGELRWKPAEPPEQASVAIQANRFPGRCPQPPSTIPENVESEDCLYLNVWTKTDAPKKLPVMVWIHGGGNVNGYGSEWVYDGRIFATRYDVVLVSINYRLGIFGFFAPEAVTAEAGTTGNQGLWDQVRALEWVQDNIERFGGDPENVTIFGESAGAADVCMLMASPASRGLFHRAISQSGGCTTRRSSLATAQRTAAAFATRIGCAGDDPAAQLACLRTQSTRSLIDAAAMGAIGAGGIVDGVFMPEQPRALFDRGEIAPVPYMLGSTTDEGSYWTLNDTGITNDEQYLEALRKRFPEPVEPIAEMYPASKFAGAKNPYQAALTRAHGDGRLVCSTQDVAVRAAAAGNPVYNYNYDIPVDEVLGAAHASELVLVFGTAINFTPQTERVSERMMRYWTNFAKTGDPNGDDLLAWPAWEPETNVRINFGIESTLAPDFRGPECELWRARYEAAFAQP